MTSPVSLVLADVSLRTRQGTALVSGVTLSVPAGSHWAVVGPNGAGKTSLLRLVTGQAAASTGEVRLDGHPIAALSAQQRARRIAVVAQTDHPDLRLTLRDYVGLGRLPHRGRVADARHGQVVAESLTKSGIAHLADRPLATLSGGERQRGALARALAQEPGLLVLDEPTNHLDPRARADMLSLVRELGITVIAVLHDLPLVAPFADAVAVLRAGSLVTQGPPAVALAPALVRDVFGLDSFKAVNPATARSVLVFDALPSSC